MVQNSAMSEEEYNAELEKINYYYTYEWQDIREVRANALLTHYVKEYNMPLIFRAGLSSEVYKDEDNSVIAAFDFTTLSDTPEQFAVGAEYTFKNLICIRAGYLMNHDQFGLSGGIGFKYEAGSGMKAGVDYSINPTNDIGIVNRLSVRIGF